MKKRLLSAFLSLCMVLTMVPAVAFAVEDPNVVSESVNLVQGDETNANNNDSDDKQLAEKEELAGDGNESDLTESAPVYVSDSGNDETGEGTAESPYATLAKAVEEAPDGATIYVMSNLTMTKCARYYDKDLTITSGEGGPYTISRGESFDTLSDNARIWYNPALIEVDGTSSDSASLILTNIVLDDKGLHTGSYFVQADSDGDGHTTVGSTEVSHTDIVQDAMIATYNGVATITLGEGAVLKNYGGMCAVRLSDGTLVMKDGSQIIDDQPITRVKGEGKSFGPAGAIWMQGGTVTMEEGSVIGGQGDVNMIGRAIYADGGSFTVNGTIQNLKGSDVMWMGQDGVVFHLRSGAEGTLGATGRVTGVEGASSGNNSAIWTQYCNFTAQAGSRIENVNETKLVYFDDAGKNYAHKVLLNGTISNCTSSPACLLYAWYGHIELGANGVIENCTSNNAGGLLYSSNGTKYTISGIIQNNTAGNGMIYMVNQGGGRPECTLTETAKIINNDGLGIRVNNGSLVTMNGGEISGNRSYGVRVSGKDAWKGVTFIMNGGKICNNSSYGIYHTVAGESLVEINGGEISGNQGSFGQISASGGYAVAAQGDETGYEYTHVKAGILGEPRTVYVSAGTVELPEGYADVNLGRATTDAVNAMKNGVAAQYQNWTAVGSSALWLQPSQDGDFSFRLDPLATPKKTGLFVVYLPVNPDGSPVEGAQVTIEEVENNDVVDIILKNLTANTPYAVMLFNNAEYTLAPDDITIYTGGGQGDETYDDGGLPMLTVSNSVDDIKTLSIGGEEITGDDLMAELLSYLTVSYTDADGNPVDSDEEAGEYTATLAWKDGNSVDLRINGNEVADEFDDGTLIVRYIEDVEEATSGESTYPLLTDEPADPVTHAEAIAKKGFSVVPPSFYTNNDENREVDAGGIQILDDSLLIDEDGTDRQSLLEDKAEASNLLPALGEGQAYRYDFHYLDLVDAYNGNAWVSARYGTTVYLPYPVGTDQSTNFTLVHFKDLHREYGISGQADVEDAIAACELEAMEITKTDVGIQFDVEEAGFSPFALVWQTDAVTITATAGNGGSISPAGEVVVAKGTDQKFTITPDSGYAIADVKVDGKSEGAVSTYIFENVTGDHTIEASFRSTGGGSTGGGTTYYTLKYESNGGTAYDDERYTSNTVVDLDKVPSREGYTFTGWYADAELTDHITEIKMTSNKTVYAGWEAAEVPDWLNGDDHFAYVTGYPDGTVKPQNNISRAEVATIFFRLLTPEIRDENLTQTSQFADVSADAWYNTAVSTIAALGIVNGRTADTFAPDASITRAEFAAICARFDTNKRDGDSNFSDIAGHWAEAEIERAATLGWINGYSDGTFHPDNAITRAEAMTMINRVLQRLPETEDDLLDDMNVWPDNQPSAWYYLAVQEATNSHDFDRKDDGVHETWTSRNTDPDWMQYQ